MLFQRSLERELSKTFTATLAVFITIVMTMMMYRTLGFAAKGAINPNEVIAIIGLSVLGHLPTLFTLSLFVCVISVLSRLLRDNEMIIWLTSGQSLWQFVRPILRFSWPLIAAVCVMALFVWPWTNAQMQTLKDSFERRGDLERVSPGQFQESANGDRVFYVDKRSSDRVANNIFVFSLRNGREAIISAKSAHVEVQTQQGLQERLLVFDQGQRIERDLQTLKGDPAQAALVWTQFDTMRTSMPHQIPITEEALAKTRTTADLINAPTPEHQAELAWRFSLVFAAFNLVLLALSLIGFRPRTGRSTHLMAALLAFMVYYNFINVAQVWIASARVDAIVAMMVLHGSALLLALLGLKLRAG